MLEECGHNLWKHWHVWQKEVQWYKTALNTMTLDEINKLSWPMMGPDNKIYLSYIWTAFKNKGVKQLSCN